ncbi:MAG: N-6 DNA methylase, partial [Paludibacteraceae bacterium]|nr:N-6 DNA methylase [Paludibacteraceae bacterium]
DLDERIAWIVDDLGSAFAATDMEKIMHGFGKSTQQTDPMLHFYEDVLFQYDPAAKKQCGVYYTPQPVVEFIVRAVDDILRTEFNLPMGLADTSKVEIEQEIEQDLKHRKEKKLVHRVQVLDPATGTGTFLAETVRQIKRDLGGQMGAWPSYVPEHLLPRLHGFELMMAPYTIAHLKLDMEIGIPAQQRLKVFLTNSLEEADKEAGTLFGNYLAQEANEASHIKQSAPVMIVMGNPPYSGISQNNGEWITNLLADYKKEPGGVLPLQERKIWLNDDYCKFIRLGQYYVDRNKEGVLAYICNNGFLDNTTFRGMRWHLLQSFDKIYVINLHGNSMKKEVCSDGEKDENVFDIMVGTSINIFVKTGQKKKGTLANVYYTDIYGLRKTKYNILSQNTLTSLNFKTLPLKEPFYFFIPTDEEGRSRYEEGFRIDNLMPLTSSGIVSMGDSLAYANDAGTIRERIGDVLEKEYTSAQLTEKYNLGKNYADYIFESKRNGLQIDENKIVKVKYRPFDDKWTYFDNRVLWRSRETVMRHLTSPNLGFVCVRINSKDEGTYFVVDNIMDKTILSSKDNANVFPLYLYPEEGSFDAERRANIDETIANKIAEILHWAYVPDSRIVVDLAEGYENVLYPEDIFDYIYGVLHSPAYRAKYKEFLKVDFPRIPYPKNADEFEHFRSFGNQLRELHLMHNVPESPVSFPESGSLLVEKVEFSLSAAPGVSAADTSSVSPESHSGRVYINATQYFANVPTEAWEFYIGGYQPAQKWLKDRKGRVLSFDDIEHYRKIISVLIETKAIMEEMG